MNGAKNRAKSKKIPFDLDKDYLKGLWEGQGGKCPITGYKFDLSLESSLQKGWARRNAPSLDRIVPSIGYVKGNVRFVTYQVNMAKGPFTDEEFFEMCERATKDKRR